VAWARLAVAYQFAEDISASPSTLQGLATSTTQQDAARAVISGVTSFATIATAYPASGRALLLPSSPVQQLQLARLSRSLLLWTLLV